MNPKKFLLSFIIAVSVFSATAQERFEFHTGYGMYSLEEAMWGPTSDGNLIADLTIRGSYFTTARYRLFERFALGLTINYYHPRHIIGIGPDFVFYYNRQSLFRLYMSGELGAEWGLNTSLKSGNMLIHYSPIGVRVGKTVAAFTELGIGSKGLLNFGLSYMPGGN